MVHNVCCLSFFFPFFPRCVLYLYGMGSLLVLPIWRRLALIFHFCITIRSHWHNNSPTLVGSIDSQAVSAFICWRDRKALRPSHCQILANSSSPGGSEAPIKSFKNEHLIALVDSTVHKYGLHVIHVIISLVLVLMILQYICVAHRSVGYDDSCWSNWCQLKTKVRTSPSTVLSESTWGNSSIIFPPHGTKWYHLLQVCTSKKIILGVILPVIKKFPFQQTWSN